MESSQGFMWINIGVGVIAFLVFLILLKMNQLLEAVSKISSAPAGHAAAQAPVAVAPAEDDAAIAIAIAVAQSR